MAGPAACHGRRYADRHLHAALDGATAQAVAGVPQSLDAAGGHPRPGHLAGLANVADLGRAGAADAPRPVPRRSHGGAHRATPSASSSRSPRWARVPPCWCTRRCSHCRPGRCRPAAIEGASARAQHGPHLTPLVTSVRPYTPGDAFNRIHWRSSARHQELQVKEFDIEPSADLWIFIDLDRAVHVGSWVRTPPSRPRVSAAAALAAHALTDDRGVGMEAVGLRRAVIGTDRGARQQHKVMSLLAVAQAEGSTPLAEMLVEGAAHMRRGTVALAVTPSLDRSWVAPLAALRGAGVAPIACVIDPLAHVDASLAAGGQERTRAPRSASRSSRSCGPCCTCWPSTTCVASCIRPGAPLGEQLVTTRGGSAVARGMSRSGRRLRPFVLQRPRAGLVEPAAAAGHARRCWASRSPMPGPCPVRRWRIATGLAGGDDARGGLIGFLLARSSTRRRARAHPRGHRGRTAAAAGGRRGSLHRRRFSRCPQSWAGPDRAHRGGVGCASTRT